eukprot:TCONS_00021129-protein
MFKENDKWLCYSKTCLSLRGVYASSGKLEEFSCQHKLSAIDTENSLYSLRFTEQDVREFTPDKSKEEEMLAVQHPTFPTVVKISQYSYAVIGPVSTSTPVRYTHVQTNGKDGWYCTNNSCKKKKGATKRVHGKTTCIHRHYVYLARKIKESPGPGISKTVSNSDVEGKVPCFEDQHRRKTIDLQFKYSIPYIIPPKILRLSDNLNCNESLIFEPDTEVCRLCGFSLSKSSNQHGIKDCYIITNKDPFNKVTIKVKKCQDKSNCGATNMVFPYEQGLFNVSNKILVGLDIMIEIREFFKDGVPLSNIIERKLNSLLLKMELVERPRNSQIDYFVKLLYDGFYGFEAMTERNLNDNICGYCGIIGRVYYGDGNEKNCCSLKDVITDSKKKVTTSKNDISTCQIEVERNKEIKDDKLSTMLSNVKQNLLRKCTYAKDESSFKISIGDLAPLIPSAMCCEEINTEADKKSVFTHAK